MAKGRAVILGGGGVTGIAWETGILQGLDEEGVALGWADAIIGTSAGSFAGTYLACGLVKHYFDLQFSDDTVEIPASMSPESIAAFQQAIVDGGSDKIATGRALGRLALQAKTVSSEDRAAVVESRLPLTGWPDRPLAMTAIDAESGELCLFDSRSGVPLTIAAAASGAVPGLWPFVETQGRKWIDGGSASATNAHLGADYERVIVIAPAAEGFPGQRGTRDDVSDLQSAGIKAILVAPDDRTKEAIGDNVFDPSRRGPAAEAGRLQAKRIAADVRAVWEPAS